MAQIYVFHEFAQLETLERLVGPVKRMSPLKDNLSEIYKTNIKIFFNNNKEEAYRIKHILEENSFASFVTDQLTMKLPKSETYPDGHTILLSKDRIIMKLN